MTRLQCIGGIGVCLALALPAFAEAPAGEKEAKDWTWALSAEARVRGEWRDDLDLMKDVDDDLRQGLLRLRLGFELAYREDYAIFIQAQDSRVFGSEVSTASNEQNLDLHQGYFDLRRMCGRDLGLRVGRQELIYGSERLLGAFGWDNVGRAFDGVRLRWAPGAHRLDALYARISNVVNAGASEGSDLVGLYYRNTMRGPAAEYEAYWMAFLDHIQAAGESGVLADSAVHAFGLRAADRFGGLDFVVEVVGEAGEWRGDDLSALAAGVQVGWTWGAERKLRLFGGYDYATGDEDPADGDAGEFFNFFPTNHLHYGYADLFGWRNLESPYLGVRYAWPKQWVQAKVHDFSLESAAGPWKSAGGTVLGFDPTGSSGTDVGWEVDVNYRVAFHPKASFEAGYSYFSPDGFAEATRGPDPQNWAYAMFTLGF